MASWFLPWPRSLDVESLAILRLLSEDERGLRLRLFPRSELDGRAADVGC